MGSKRFEDNVYRHMCSEKTLQSNSQGFFLSFADYVSKQAGEKWIRNVFGKLKTDYERIQCVYTSKETSDMLEHFLSKVQEVYRPKNSEISSKKRSEADALLNQNDAHKAVQLFSQSVLRAAKTGEQKNVDSGLSLSLALWGRARALIKLQKYSNALADIQQALKENLPDSYKARAFWKMGICRKALGDANRAKVSFDLAEKLLHNDTENLEALLRDRQRTYKELEAEDGNKALKNHSENPQITGELSSELINASSKLSVKTSKKMGRYITANQRISSGETLVVEPPYAACLLPDMFSTHCHHCFKSLESPVGCTDCASVAFCSTECRDKALSTYHRYECKYLDLLIGSGMSILGHTSLRMVTQNGVQNCLNVYEQRANERLYQLCTNSHLRSPGDFLQRTLMAAFLLRCLQKSNFFGMAKTDRVIPSDVEYRIGAMLLFNLQMLQFNAHEIYETRHSPDSKIKDSKTAYIGVAVYLTASLFNHDCYPALARYFVGKNIVLTSSRPLEPNELVPENYGPVFTRRNLVDRKTSLSSRYWFDCQCLACIQDWPAIGRGLENVSQRLRCPSEPKVRCSHSFTLPLAKADTKCLKCKKCVDLSGQTQLLKWCEDQYDVAFELMNKSDIEKAVHILCAAIDAYYRAALPPNKQTQLAEEMLRICLADSGNRWGC